MNSIIPVSDKSMAEKQQDLARRPSEVLNEPLQSSEYFSRLYLRKIYGDYTLKPGTTIVTDIPNDATFDHKLFEDHEKLKELAERYGIPRVASGHYGGFGTKWQKPFVEISAGMDVPITNWSPYVSERGAISALAASLTDKDKPVVLDVGCGNGFTSRLLAVDGNLKVVGIDPQYSKYTKQVPYTKGDIELREASVFDVLDELGPPRSSQDLARIKEILKTITGSFEDQAEMYFWAAQHGMHMGYKDFGSEVRELQKLARKTDGESPIDLVVCSFMTTGTDLTLAIRDGIRPKAIVYVMPMRGFAGVGNYYGLEADRQRGDDLENKVVSFNPGNSYRTVARWQTFWQDEWGRTAYEQPLAMEPAEVVVQVRKDIRTRSPKTPPTVQSYGWDAEIAEIIRKEVARPKHTVKDYPFPLDYFKGVDDVHGYIAGQGATIRRLLPGR